MNDLINLLQPGVNDNKVTSFKDHDDLSYECKRPEHKDIILECGIRPADAFFEIDDGKVEKGQVIGAVGKTAPFEIEDPPHLHFEVLKDGENIDPEQYLPKLR